MEVSEGVAGKDARGGGAKKGPRRGGGKRGDRKKKKKGGGGGESKRPCVHGMGSLEGVGEV